MSTEIKALVFDVFGTVVDWRSSIILESREIGAAKNISRDWESFADSWRSKYGPFMNKVRQGSLSWTNLDDLHYMALEELLSEFEIQDFDDNDKKNLNTAWHRLDPWPDAIQGLNKLRESYIIAPLSNGNLALLTNMAKRAGLPWDCILSAELAHAYKPDQEVYRMAAKLLGLAPGQLLMVAAHPGDLMASQQAGLQTAFIPRPFEHGQNQNSNTDAETISHFDIVAKDIVDLAYQLSYSRDSR